LYVYYVISLMLLLSVLDNNATHPVVCDVILLTSGKHLHDRVISLRGEVWTNKIRLWTNKMRLIPPIYIEMFVSSKD